MFYLWPFSGRQSFVIPARCLSNDVNWTRAWWQHNRYRWLYWRPAGDSAVEIVADTCDTALWADFFTAAQSGMQGGARDCVAPRSTHRLSDEELDLLRCWTGHFLQHISGMKDSPADAELLIGRMLNEDPAVSWRAMGGVLPKSPAYHPLRQHIRNDNGFRELLSERIYKPTSELGTCCNTLALLNQRRITLTFAPRGNTPPQLDVTHRVGGKSVRFELLQGADAGPFSASMFLMHPVQVEKVERLRVTVSTSAGAGVCLLESLSPDAALPTVNAPSNGKPIPTDRPSITPLPHAGDSRRWFRYVPRTPEPYVNSAGVPSVLHAEQYADSLTCAPYLAQMGQLLNGVSVEPPERYYLLTYLQAPAPVWFDWQEAQAWRNAAKNAARATGWSDPQITCAIHHDELLTVARHLAANSCLRDASRNSPASFVVLDIGQHSTKAALFRWENNGAAPQEDTVEQLGAWWDATGGQDIETHAASYFLRELENQTGLPTTRWARPSMPLEEIPAEIERLRAEQGGNDTGHTYQLGIELSAESFYRHVQTWVEAQTRAILVEDCDIDLQSLFPSSPDRPFLIRVARNLLGEIPPDARNPGIARNGSLNGPPVRMSLAELYTTLGSRLEGWLTQLEKDIETSVAANNAPPVENVWITGGGSQINGLFGMVSGILLPETTRRPAAFNGSQRTVFPMAPDTDLTSVAIDQHDFATTNRDATHVVLPVEPTVNGDNRQRLERLWLIADGTMQPGIARRWQERGEADLLDVEVPAGIEEVPIYTARRLAQSEGQWQLRWTLQRTQEAPQEALQVRFVVPAPGMLHPLSVSVADAGSGQPTGFDEWLTLNRIS